jgi:hypothetical protein
VTTPTWADKCESSRVVVVVVEEVRYHQNLYVHNFFFLSKQTALETVRAEKPKPWVRLRRVSSRGIDDKAVGQTFVMPSFVI